MEEFEAYLKRMKLIGMSASLWNGSHYPNSTASLKRSV